MIHNKPKIKVKLDLLRRYRRLKFDKDFAKETRLSKRYWYL